jgi:hypothetical protein
VDRRSKPPGFHKPALNVRNTDQTEDEIKRLQEERMISAQQIDNTQNQISPAIEVERHAG